MSLQRTSRTTPPATPVITPITTTTIPACPVRSAICAPDTVNKASPRASATVSAWRGTGRTRTHTVVASPAQTVTTTYAGSRIQKTGC